MQYKGQEKRPKATRTIEDQPFSGSVEGFDRLSGEWFLHEHPCIRHFNIHASVIRRPGSGLDRVDQVLVNHSPMGRGVWRLKPFIDRSSRVFASSLISVRPLNAEVPLEYLWALCVSPVAQFYAYCYMLKRNIHTGILGKMPVPKSGNLEVSRISSAAIEYLKAASERRTLFEQGGPGESKLRSLLFTLDAEVLRLYDLPSHAERLLLDQFAGEERPGVPFSFTRYYPPDFTVGVPLYVYLSDVFQRFVRGETAELDSEQEKRYDVLVAKSDAGRINNLEKEELHRLQAEVNGRDFALHVARGGGSRQPVSNSRKIDAKLKRLDDALASAMLKEARGS